MKINAIGNTAAVSSAVYNKQFQVNKKNINININKQKEFEFPSYGFYNDVSFTGGKSLDLAAAKRQLDMYAQYPEYIKEDIENVLRNGNPDNKTLIDVHIDRYKYLDECDTLEFAKSLYPEFKDVLSDKDVKYNKKSFINAVKNGEIKEFDKDTDVSLQLLRLYWGKGFSLNSLEEQFTDRGMMYVFNKLNIPRFDTVYAKYLKLSDRDYNERFTSYMSERLKGKTGRKKPLTEEERQALSAKLNAHNAEHPRTEEHKKAISDGLLEHFRNYPMDDKWKQAISDGLKAFYAENPMTDEQKKAISDGLIEYYAENPEKLAERSELRKKFFEEHPEERERFSLVLLRAWAYPEAAQIRQAMSEFMSGDSSLNYDEVILLLAEDEELSEERNFKGFWEANNWARKVFSECMKMSWAEQKELEQTGYISGKLYKPVSIPSGNTMQPDKSQASDSVLNEKNEEETAAEKKEKERQLQVLQRALNYKEAKPVRNALSEFTKKKNLSGKDASKIFIEDAGIIQGFWKKNPKLKGLFSKCMEKSEAAQTALEQQGLFYEPLYKGSIMPQGLSARLKSFIPDIEEKMQFFIFDEREDKEAVKNYSKKANTGLNDTLRILSKDNDTLLVLKWIYSLAEGVCRAVKSNQEYSKSGGEFFKYINENNASISSFYNAYINIIDDAVRNNDINFARKIEEGINSSYLSIKKLNPEKLEQRVNSIFASYVKSAADENSAEEKTEVQTAEKELGVQELSETEEAAEEDFTDMTPEEHQENASIAVNIYQRVWNSPKAEPLRKEIMRIKGLNKNDTLNILDMIAYLTGSDKDTAAFYNKNPWAVKLLAGCLNESRARQHELSKLGFIYDPAYEFDIMPRKLKYSIAASPKINQAELDSIARYIIPDSREKGNAAAKRHQYLEDEIMNFIASYTNNNAGSWIKWMHSLTEGISKTVNSNSDYEDYKKSFFDKIEYEDLDTEGTHLLINIKTLILAYIELVKQGVNNNDKEFLKKLDFNINRSYEGVMNDKDFNKIVKRINKCIASNIQDY